MKKFNKLNLHIKILILLIKKYSSIIFIPFGIISFIATLGMTTPTILGIKNLHLWIAAFSLPLVILIILIIIKKPFSEIKKIKEGEILNIYEIKNLHLTPKIIIIGLSNVGKTTLINSFFHERFAKSRTQNIEGRIKIHKNQALCLIDMSGEQIYHAYQVLKLANFIVLMVDHSESHSSKKIVLSRQSDVRDFIEKIKDNVDGNYDDKKSIPSLFIVNKKDLWSESAEKSKEALQSNYKNIYKEWKNYFGDKSEYIEYTNKNDYDEKISSAVILDKICEGVKGVK